MSETRPTRVLVIEDEQPVRDSFQSFLEDQGHAVATAADGAEGVRIFHANEPDIVLLDLRMPRMDGHQVLQQLATDAPDTPLIVISGTGDIRDTVKALRLGAWDYLLKPITDLDILDHAIRQALEKARLIRENRAHHSALEKKVEQRTRELTEKIAELQRFNKMAVGRERRVIELKRIVNDLLEQLGRPPRFASPEKIEEAPNLVD